MGQNLLTQLTKITHCRAKLHGLPYRGCWLESEQGAVLFREKRERRDKRPNDTARHSLNRKTLPPYFHLAGTQTALPSVPVLTKVTFVAVPAPFLDSKTFFPGKKVLAWFLWYFLFTRKESTEKKHLRILSSSNLTIRRK